MNEIVTEGKTVDVALEEALQKLSTTREKVEVEVLEEGNKGFLGIIGGKDAKIRVKKKEDKHKKALNFMNELIDKMNLGITVEELESESNSEQVVINLTGPNLGIVIGRRGKTLDALQYLANLAINKYDDDDHLRVIIDAEGYRERRKETLQDLALRLASKAKNKGKKVVLEPMPPHERMIIHSTLQDDPKVRTHSEGQDPYRKVIIVAQ
ncbi:spoIIIJ-associated protein [Candidatus Frackibacter sp. WG12]|uniref:RNA-binding cell elongation regulator Jag/EloR n=1 Tax=Candidatus Frackibacter sp. WG12 TaxID=2017977 RepID=UPI0008D8CF9B|nr:RNA-binding cell elongation regulator Jag/EloR [Candidatus Frackibacter sp. WG12]SEM64134.1 spoIIIJ-associated protein [Candidatus Frackibacter sp. WG12]